MPVRRDYEITVVVDRSEPEEPKPSPVHPWLGTDRAKSARVFVMRRHQRSYVLTLDETAYLLGMILQLEPPPVLYDWSTGGQGGTYWALTIQPPNRVAQQQGERMPSYWYPYHDVPTEVAAVFDWITTLAQRTKLIPEDTFWFHLHLTLENPDGSHGFRTVEAFRLRLISLLRNKINREQIQ